MSDRRSFLRGLVSLPLIGGGVTLIGRPAAAVPLIQAAALPDLGDARQRARYAWAAFSAAMREITADADGWAIEAAYERFRGVPDSPYMPAASFMRPVRLRHVPQDNPWGSRPFWREDVERFEL